VNVPLPLPVAPAVTVIQVALLVAFQLHPVGAKTVIVPAVPVAPALTNVGRIVVTHDTPGWVTVNVLPPIVRVPVRDIVPVFAATA
jgi:hypothetical protein